MTTLKSLLSLTDLWNGACSAVGKLIYSFADLWHSASDEDQFRVRATGTLGFLVTVVEGGYLSFAHPQFVEALRKLRYWDKLDLHLWLDLAFGVLVCTVATWWLLGWLLRLRLRHFWLFVAVLAFPFLVLLMWPLRWPPSVAADQILRLVPGINPGVRHLVEWVVPVVYGWGVLPVFSCLLKPPATYRTGRTPPVPPSPRQS